MPLGYPRSETVMEVSCTTCLFYSENDHSNSVGLVKVEELIAIGFAAGYEYTKGILVN